MKLCDYCISNKFIFFLFSVLAREKGCQFDKSAVVKHSNAQFLGGGTRQVTSNVYQPGKATSELVTQIAYKHFKLEYFQALEEEAKHLQVILGVD